MIKSMCGEPIALVPLTVQPFVSSYFSSYAQSAYWMNKNLHCCIWCFNTARSSLLNLVTKNLNRHRFNVASYFLCFHQIDFYLCCLSYSYATPVMSYSVFMNVTILFLLVNLSQIFASDFFWFGSVMTKHPPHSHQLFYMDNNRQMKILF